MCCHFAIYLAQDFARYLAYSPSMDQLAGLTDEARTLALDRFRLLQPHLEGNRPLKTVAAAAGIPFRTAQRWVSLYRQFGLGALARKKRTDTGQHREVSAKLKDVIEGIALQKPPLPIATICRQVRQLALDLGEEPPSYWVVYRIVADLPSDLLPSLTKARRRTATYSNWFIVGKRLDPTPSGRPTTRRSTFSWSTPTEKPPTPGSPP